MCYKMLSGNGSSFYRDRNMKVAQCKQMNEPPLESFILDMCIFCSSASKSTGNSMDWDRLTGSGISALSPWCL